MIIGTSWMAEDHRDGAACAQTTIAAQVREPGSHGLPPPNLVASAAMP